MAGEGLLSEKAAALVEGKSGGVAQEHLDGDRPAHLGQGVLHQSPACTPAGQGGVYIQPGQLVVCEGGEPGGLAVQLRHPEGIVEQALPLGGDLQGEKGVGQSGQGQLVFPGRVMDGAQPGPVAVPVRTDLDMGCGHEQTSQK